MRLFHKHAYFVIILWVYYTIPFGVSLFMHFRYHISTFLNYFVWLRITDEGSLPEMRIWSILLIKSDLKWCIHLIRSLCIFPNIYNGNIFPSLNPAKIFQFISRWTESTKSSAVGPNHRAVINTSNEVRSPLLWEFWIYNFSLRILERVLGWKHCKYKEWVSFFLGSWGMNRSAEQTNRQRTASRFTRFVCPALRFIPHEPRKKDTHSLKKSF